MSKYDPTRQVYELVQEGKSLQEIADGMQMTLRGVEMAIESYRKTIPIIQTLKEKAEEIKDLVWKDDVALPAALEVVLGKTGLLQLKQSKYSAKELMSDVGVSLAEARKALRRQVESEIVITAADKDLYFRNRGEAISAVEFRVLQILMDRLADDPDCFTNPQLIKFYKELVTIQLCPNPEKKGKGKQAVREIDFELSKFSNATKVSGDS